MERLRAWMIRLLSAIFDRDNKQPAASKESLAIMYNINKAFGELPSKVLLSLIYQYPDRHYYKEWFFPDHTNLFKLLNISELEYNKILTSLVKGGMLKRQKDKKGGTHKMMYAIQFETLGRFQHGIPAEMATI